MGPLARGISGAIGLATESYAHHKESKAKAHEATQHSNSALDGQSAPSIHANPQATSDPPPLYSPGNQEPGQDQDISGDEESDSDVEDDWDRDDVEAQLEHKPSNSSSQDNRTVEQLVDDFTRLHPPPKYAEAVGRLQNPVIIPQRRPETNTRGFVRAYAPDLNSCGIDQTTFMDFLDGFHKAISKQGFFHVLNLAVAISVLAETVAVAPSIAVHIAAFITHTSIEAGRRLYTHNKTNTYLEQMNEKLFKPHGLYAMIMTYKPESKSGIEAVDMNTNITQAVAARSEGKRSKFHSASGTTHGESQMPIAAPLVFPATQAATDEQKKNAFERAFAFKLDYSDKRHQAEFAAENPDSQLNVMPKPEFSSRWADPNHPTNQGGLIGVLTGGVFDPRVSRRQRRARLGLRPAAGDRRKARKSGKGGRPSLVGSARRKLLSENVLYLMIVNTPTEAEMHEAQAIVSKIKHQTK